MTTTKSIIGVRTIPAGSGKGSPLAPALYTPHQTRDGRWVWRLSRRYLLGTVHGGDGSIRERGVYSLAKAERIADDLAASLGCDVGYVRHNQALTANQIATFVND
jgi:hypothetical protein